MLAIDRYLLRRILSVILVTLLIAGVMLVMERFIRILELTVGTGVSTLVTIRLLLDLIPHYVQLILPLGLFLGTLLAFRELSSHSELYVMESLGLGIGRLVRAPMVLAGAMAVLGFLTVGYIEPLSRYSYHALLHAIENGLVRSGLEEGTFIDLPNGYVVRADRTRRGGSVFSNFFAYRKVNATEMEIITANYGVIDDAMDRQDVVLRLFDGEQSFWRTDRDENQEIQFDGMTLPFDLQDIAPFRGRGDVEPRELLLHELIFRYGGFGAAAPEASTLAQAQPGVVAAELHGRVVYSLSIVFMPLLAVPFGILRLRSNRAGGIAAGLAALVGYQKILEFEEEVLALDTAYIGLLMWATFAIFAAATTTLFLKTAKGTGDTPFQRFEEAVLDIGKAIRKPVATLWGRRRGVL